MLHYQPLMNCGTGEVEGFEAFPRWNHPVRGMLEAKEFIPLAEESGHVAPLGRYVLEMACLSAATWDMPRFVAVNLSLAQLDQPDLCDVVATCLGRAGLPATRLQLEVTEAVFGGADPRIAATLARLRAMGARIALTNIGAGHSTLGALADFDRLKIDGAFIQRIGEAGSAATIMRAIVGLARDLGLTVVAEAVETEGQLACVRELMGDQARGFLFGRPIWMDIPNEVTSGRANISLFDPATSGGATGRNDPAGVPGRNDPAGVPGRTDPAGMPGRTDPAGVPGRTDPTGALVLNDEQARAAAS